MSTIINDRDVWLESVISRFGVSTVQPANAIGSLQANNTGLSIAAAKKMDLVATSQAFITANGSTEPPIIIVSPTLRNLTGTPTYSVISGSATLTASNDSVTVTFGAMGNRATVKATLSSGGITYEDQITLVKINSGTGVVPLLTNESHNYLADTFGNILNYIGGSGTFRVWDGTFEVTNACTFSVLTNSSNLLVNISNIGQYAVTGMPSGVDTATVVFRATYNSVNYDQTFLVRKLKAAAGTPADPTQYTAGGLRIPVKASVPVGANSWSNATATALFTSVGGPVLNDVVTEYNNTTNPPFQETRFYSGGVWNLMTASIDGNLLVDGTVSADKLAAYSITADKIAIGVISGNTPGSITGTMIADGTITTAKIAVNAITADRIAVGVIGSTGQPGSITGTMIANGTITSANIAANTIAADRIVVGAFNTNTSLGNSGSITGTMIANGTITSANIAANTITADRIAVGVVNNNSGSPGSITGTMIADGTITTNKINVGMGNNMLQNSGPGFKSTFCWAQGWNNNPGATMTQPALNSQWCPTGGRAVYIMLTNATNGKEFDMVNNGPGGAGYPVIAGQRYEFGCCISSHRATTRAYVNFYNAAGTDIGNTDAWGNYVTDNQQQNNTSITNFQKSQGFVTAPAGAAYCTFVIRGVTQGANPYTFVSNAFLAAAYPNQTAFSTWTEGGMSVIDGQGISTPNLSAISSDIGTVTAGFIRGNSIAGGPGYTTPNYQWPGDQGNGASNGGFHLSQSGLLLGNPGTGRYFQIEANGDISAPGFATRSGNAQFSGLLTANNMVAGNHIVYGAVSNYAQTSIADTLSYNSGVYLHVGFTSQGGNVTVNFSGNIRSNVVFYGSCLISLIAYSPSGGQSYEADVYVDMTGTNIQTNVNLTRLFVPLAAGYWVFALQMYGPDGGMGGRWNITELKK